LWICKKIKNNYFWKFCFASLLISLINLSYFLFIFLLRVICFLVLQANLKLLKREG
jgi:hypothetical protein